VASRFLALQPQAVPVLNFDRHEQVIYYETSEYLPPLDTRENQPLEKPRNQTVSADPDPPDPVLSRQAVISVPPEADNRSQTIVTPPSIKLRRDTSLPNIVRWSDTPEMPRLDIPPAPLVPAAEIARVGPQMASAVVAPPPQAAGLPRRADAYALRSVVAPPPDLRASRTAKGLAGPEPAVIAPAPSVEKASARPIGDLEIGRSAVIAPAPQLAVGPQRTATGGRSSALAASGPQVVAPPPSLAGSSAGSGSRGRMIALSLHPAVGAPPDPPAGNRRGAFAATPEGRPGAEGTPGHGNGGGSGRQSSSLPAGLYIGNVPASARTASMAGDPTAGRKGTSARVSTPARSAPPDIAAKLTEPERAVFAGRKFYSLMLNMPNLNSAGGSWIVRFAELNHDSKDHDSKDHESSAHDSNSPAADLSQPNAIREVDPGYPIQLIKENVAGTVILYAVIQADGHVGNVRVLRGVDERLDRFASEAVAQWQFQPAMKNGSPVAVEATFQIPFRPPRMGTNF
jgi:TonB family protein